MFQVVFFLTLFDDFFSVRVFSSRFQFDFFRHFHERRVNSFEFVLAEKNRLITARVRALKSFLLYSAMLTMIHNRKIIYLLVVFLTVYIPAFPRRIGLDVSLAVRAHNGNSPFVQDEEIRAEGQADSNGISDKRGHQILQDEYQRYETNEDNPQIQGRP